MPSDFEVVQAAALLSPCAQQYTALVRVKKGGRFHFALCSANPRKLGAHVRGAAIALSLSLSICLSILSICLPIDRSMLSIYRSTDLSVYLSIYSIHLSIHPSIYLSTYSIYLSIALPIDRSTKDHQPIYGPDPNPNPNL